MSGLVAVAFFAASPVSAQTLADSLKKVPGIDRMLHKNTVVGTVSVVSGTTINLNAFNMHSSTTSQYTIDASNAAVFKGGATSSLSEIVAGDKIVVRGAITGTNVIATKIRNVESMKHLRGHYKNFASSTDKVRAKFTLGNVVAVDGDRLTIVDKGHRDNATTTYNVITGGTTTFKKAGKSATLADVTVGQFVMVAGAKNSSNDTITATRVNVVTKPEWGEGKGPRRSR